ncbi:hypothetical protein [Halomonas binhaiensis]|uniref:Uncharacterized protein n=1 Tax=Halomonas binhaiensis TaxID=2562282 RepID=A0A5C1NM01_9GAMM|nr:hypothetical protein [Halomonas binhaiensis]QEM83448.1 hypothetical protein E4T21_19215 [Halomonas binhaiensis]
MPSQPYGFAEVNIFSQTKKVDRVDASLIERCKQMIDICKKYYLGPEWIETGGKRSAMIYCGSPGNACPLLVSGRMAGGRSHHPVERSYFHVALQAWMRSGDLMLCKLFMQSGERMYSLSLAKEVKSNFQ